MLRRTFITSTSAGLAALGLGPPFGSWRLRGQGGLQSRAAARGLFFGCSLRTGLLEQDQAFAQAVFAECGLIVPETAFKWDHLRPSEGQFDFSQADRFVDVARTHGLKIRGHALVWYRALPPWLGGQFGGARAATLLQQHITTTVARYRGKMESWDVVNEAIDPSATRSHRPDGLSASLWLDQVGPGYIADAFHAAREADPDVLLVYNDNHMEYDTSYFDRKRAMVLDLLRKLKDQGAPVGALGMQSHMDAAETRFNPTKYRQFLADVASLGLKIILSEVDVSDEKVAGPAPVRDQAVASAYSALLSTALDERSVIGVITWGLSDRYTWLTKDHTRTDRQPIRPLPLDDAMHPKLAYDAIGGAFDAAPVRV